MVPLVRRASTVFDVGTISQAAALAALDDQTHMQTAVDKTLVEKARLLSALESSNVRVFPAFGNFVSLWFRERDEAMEVERRLAEHAVFVKALPASGGEGLVRASVGTPEDTDRFLAALERIV
jgi:histidinol-phosphate aminotransferase